MNLVEVRRLQSLLRLYFSPFAVVPISASGTTMKPQRTPVKPAVLEKERISMAHSLAPSIS